MCKRNQVERLPPFVRFDARVSKLWTVGSLAIEASLDVLNVAVQREVQAYDYQGGGTEPLTKTADSPPLFIPTLRLKAEFVK